MFDWVHREYIIVILWYIVGAYSCVPVCWRGMGNKLYVWDCIEIFALSLSCVYQEDFGFVCVKFCQLEGNKQPEVVESNLSSCWGFLALLDTYRATMSSPPGRSISTSSTGSASSPRRASTSRSRSSLHKNKKNLSVDEGSALNDMHRKVCFNYRCTSRSTV